MELKKILTGIEGLKAKGNLELEIPKITSDSREVKTGDLFVAIKGFDVDGVKFIPAAVEAGAKAILVNEESVKDVIKVIPEDVALITAPDTRIALAKCACNYYDNPSRKFQLIGVTGTKGKTTTTFMIKKILEKHGIKTGLVGTIATYIGDKKIEDSDRTTPDSLKLQGFFAQMAEEGCQAVVMEVSSQSLKLHRVDGSDFNIGVFTNFSEDHISPKEHPDMQDYFNAKLRLFKMCPTGFVNVDDIPGRFSVYNSLAAICVAEKLGCDTESIKAALEEVRVPGRSELVDNKLGLTIMIDYAHSPESLQSILQAVKSYTRGRVISVFGCGGDRDHGKRPQMGEISGKIANYTIITSDNPRTEDPETIVREIEEGMKKTNGKYECIVDRTQAIEAAIKMANKNDIIVLAGKGHETYQEINHVKHPYDERVIIKEIIDKMENPEVKE